MLKPSAVLKLIWPFLLAFVTLPASSQSQAPADVLIENARIYTVNVHQPWADALAIRNAKIVAVGTAKEIEAYRGASTRVLNAKGHAVLPSFTDCHIHFMEGSLGLTHVVLDGATTVAEIQKRVKAYAVSHPDLPWIQGMGWIYPTFGPSGMPDKKILDEVVPDRPVFLEAYDGHSSWANSKALQMAGITKSTPDPANGKIVRDPNGEATGALKEAAGHLVSKLIPKPTREERLQALRLGMREANKHGVVRVHSAGGDFEYLELYNELREKNDLTVRFYIAYFLDPPELKPEEVELIEKARKTYHDDWIAGGAVKTMLDGVIEAHTAAMLEPYSDEPTQSGKLFWQPAKYEAAIAELDRRGLQIFTHSIGDRAVREALDAYQKAEETNHTRDARPRVEHIETIAPSDISRFGKLGVIASMQPLHAYPDDDTLLSWSPAVGPERTQRAWVWHSIETSGGVLAFGSDWPVVTLNPWPGVQNAVTRKTTEGNPPGGFVPGERISLEDAIKAYTLGAAFAGHREKTEGSIEPGKLADLIVLDQDIFKEEATELSKTQVLLTMADGKVVYEAPEWSSLNSLPQEVK
ncbi:MAG TPA: amidohydrolase [Terriglobales bacterium]|nr:amidohydrolase [Terriglobales bacterium]